MTVNNHDCLFLSEAFHSSYASSQQFAYREPCRFQAENSDHASSSKSLLHGKLLPSVNQLKAPKTRLELNWPVFRIVIKFLLNGTM